MTNYIIPDENIERLEKKILKLQNRSNKNGLEPITFKKMATFGIFYPNDRGQVREEIYHNVFVEGKPPMLPGFKLIGKLEPSDKGNILSLYDKILKIFILNLAKEMLLVVIIVIPTEKEIMDML